MLNIKQLKKQPKINNNKFKSTQEMQGKKVGSYALKVIKEVVDRDKIDAEKKKGV